jgi:hypothetical protein
MKNKCLATVIHPDRSVTHHKGELDPKGFVRAAGRTFIVTPDRTYFDRRRRKMRVFCVPGSPVAIAADPLDETGPTENVAGYALPMRSLRPENPMTDSLLDEIGNANWVLQILTFKNLAKKIDLMMFLVLGGAVLLCCVTGYLWWATGKSIDGLEAQVVALQAQLAATHPMIDPSVGVYGGPPR